MLLFYASFGSFSVLRHGRYLFFQNFYSIFFITPLDKEPPFVYTIDMP